MNVRIPDALPERVWVPDPGIEGDGGRAFRPEVDNPTARQTKNTQQNKRGNDGKEQDQG